MNSVKITRDDLNAAQLRAEAGRTADAKQARRLLAIAMVQGGHPRLLAAKAAGMDRQTLRDWVRRYNADGLSGLSDRSRSGRKPQLGEPQMAALAGWVQAGPDPKQDGIVRWRCADLRDRIQARFKVALCERGVGKLLKKLDFSSISGRPLHSQSDLQAQETVKKTSPNWPVLRSRRSMPTGRLKSGSRMKPGLASKVQ
jgi:transposase